MTTPLVFVIDDNRSEIEFAELAFEESGIPVELVGFVRADEAMERLRALSEEAEARLPQLVLLDLNMPRIHGTEILGYLRGAQRLREVPAVVLTTSDSPKERQLCLALGANDFLVKPPRMDAYLRLIRSLDRYLGPAQPQPATGTPGAGTPPPSAAKAKPSTPPA